MRLRLRASGRASADVVWERYAVPERWPDWAPQLTRVECTAQRLAPGATGRVRGLGGLWLRFAITDVDAQARRWSWGVHLGPLVVRLTHGVDPDGSTWLVVRAPAPVALAYAPVAWWALQRLTDPA